MALHVKKEGERPYKIDSSPDVAVFWILQDQDMICYVLWYVVAVVVMNIIIIYAFVLDIIRRVTNQIYCGYFRAPWWSIGAIIISGSGGSF